MSIEDFKKLKTQETNSSKLKESAQGKSKKAADPRMWKHKFSSDTKIGSSLIRFLPRYVDGNVAVPWVAWTEFNFNKDNKYYHHRNLACIGKHDPIGQLNKEHWDKIPDHERKHGLEAKDARIRNVKKRYIANIVVLNDPIAPENNGKVFLYEFGPAIHKILESVWFPEYEDQTPVTFFDWDKGANLRIRSKEGNYGLSYDDSRFEDVSPLAKGNQEIQMKLYESMYDLTEFESDDNYKPYKELHQNMINVLGARYVANIMGQEFKPEDAAAAGQNPFEDEQAPKESTQVEQKTETQQETQTETHSEESSDDPFANTEEASNKQADPFVNSGVEEDDPFANINLDD